MIKASERLLHPSERYVCSIRLTGSVPLYIFATAGMRVLSANDQKAIYDAIYCGYRKSNLRFYLTRDNLRTIDGEMEAIYGWLTVNVLVSVSFSSQLTEVAHHPISSLHGNCYDQFPRPRRREHTSCLSISQASRRRPCGHQE